MRRELRFLPGAKVSLRTLEKRTGDRALLKQVRKTLGLLEDNLRHPSLQTHRFFSLVGPAGEEVFEAYAQNQTPGAYRVFFCYGPDEQRDGARIPILTIIAITPHP